MFGLVALLVFLSIALAGYALSGVAGRRELAKETVRGRLLAVTGSAATGPGPSLLRDERLSSIPFLDTLLARITLTAWLVRVIRQAGLRNRVGEVVLYMPLLACAGFLAAMLFTGNPLISATVAAVGGLLPLLVVQRMRRKRLQRFSEQLPDALDLVRAALQAGHSLATSLFVVADEFANPVAEEFGIVAEEIRLGMPLREALYRLRDRVDDPNVPLLVLGILIAHEVGGNLAEVLDNTAYTVRERFKLMREVHVMTAQGRLSGMVLTLLPLGVGLFLYFLNPTYFAPMLASQTGLYMLGYALISILVGHVVIQRIVRIRA